MPNQRLLFGDSKFDESIKTIANMVKADNPESILEFAKKLDQLRRFMNGLMIMFVLGLGPTLSGVESKRSEGVCKSKNQNLNDSKKLFCRRMTKRKNRLR